MEMVLIRHAQPAWAGADGRGVNDPGLTDRGRRQAELVAERLGTMSFDGTTELLVSTARRSRETAAPIAEAMGLEPSHHDWIHEIRLPSSWEGTPAEEIGHRLRDSRRRPRDDWWTGLEDQAESFLDFHARVTTGLDGALADRGVRPHDADPDYLWHVPQDAGRLVIVAHAGTNSVVLGHLLGIDPQPWEWERFASNHASVTILDTTPIAGGNIWSLQLFSGVAHLPDEIVSK